MSLRWPFGAAARALIDERDIAAVAVRALAGDGHAGARYLLSGPAALTRPAAGRDRPGHRPRAALGGAAPAVRRGIAGRGLGRPAFAETAVDAWEWFVDHPETVTSAVQDITGTPARSFADWAAANAAAFR